MPSRRQARAKLLFATLAMVIGWTLATVAYLFLASLPWFRERLGGDGPAAWTAAAVPLAVCFVLGGWVWLRLRRSTKWAALVGLFVFAGAYGGVVYLGVTQLGWRLDEDGARRTLRGPGASSAPGHPRAVSPWARISASAGAPCTCLERPRSPEGGQPSARQRSSRERSKADRSAVTTGPGRPSPAT